MLLGFFPFCVRSKGVVDPTQLAAEFMEASRAAGNPGPHQWQDSAFGAAERVQLKRGEHAWVRNASTQALTGSTPLLYEQIGVGVGSASLWYIPYNQSFAEVGDGDVAVSWTSQYPELVLAVCSFQFMRFDVTRFPGYVAGDSTTHRKIRAQVLLEIDGARQDGSGPFAVPTDTRYRGLGVGVRAFRSSVTALAFLPAGAHRITPVAAQTSCLNVTDGELEDATQVIDDPPSDGVCIGHRRVIVVGFPRGKQLGA